MLLQTRLTTQIAQTAVYVIQARVAKCLATCCQQISQESQPSRYSSLPAITIAPQLVNMFVFTFAFVFAFLLDLHTQYITSARERHTQRARESEVCMLLLLLLVYVCALLENI